MSMGFVKSAYIKENFGGNKMLKKLKDKKGFTLVELIVVLVILAILAALLIPALTGYIDKANKEKVVSEARMVLMAAQTEISEDYGNGKITVAADGSCTTSNTNINDEVAKLAEAKDSWNYKVKFAKDSNNAISVVAMSFSDGTYKISYANDTQFGEAEAGATCDTVDGAQITK